MDERGGACTGHVGVCAANAVPLLIYSRHIHRRVHDICIRKFRALIGLPLHNDVYQELKPEDLNTNIKGPRPNSAKPMS